MAQHHDLLLDAARLADIGDRVGNYVTRRKIVEGQEVMAIPLAEAKEMRDELLRISTALTKLVDGQGGEQG